jgi:subtilase family serine protease
LTLGISACISATAQQSVSLTDRAESPLVPSRIVERLDDAKQTKLAGNTHPLARAEFDNGLVSPQLPMERMTLVLKRSAEQEAALQALMAEQVDPKSPNFHHWLNSKEFGERFGLSVSDIQSVTSWLQNHGFRVDDVSNGRIFIHFSGTAGMVQEAFHTEIHRYNLQGVEHIANNVDPSIPEALSPVVVGIDSLHDFFSTPAHVSGGEVRRDSKTGKWTPVDANGEVKPSFTIGTGTGNTPFEEVTPYDFATIYNVLPLWNAGIDGTGVSIAIAGRSDISLADVKSFRTAFGLPTNLAQNTPQIIVNGADPGVPSAPDKEENTLDVEWSGAVAKGAQIKFVTTASTATSDGAAASAMYIIDSNPTIASIMSFSYQSCELYEGTAGNTFENNLWQQGAAEGITEFVASGDYAAAQCDGGKTGPYKAQNGLFVSGLASTPYDVAVGGTDLNWANNPKTTYWSATNNATNNSSALGYMPEVPWNTTCASDALDLFIGATAIGLDEEQTCQYLITHNELLYFVNAVGGSGGKSSCIAPTGTTVASCAAKGGYPKPSWQTGTGVPTANARYVPDLSLFASSNGMNSAYLICDTQIGPCDLTNPNGTLAQSVGGTSVASPAMSGIMALVLQKTGSAQGLANPVFYQLAAKDNLASCNTVSVVAGNSCNFYDITTDNIAVPCNPGSIDCTVHHTGDTVGIMTGNTSTTGFDLTTGLGSVNANNLVNNWVSTSGAAAVTLTPTSLTFASTAVGSTSAAQKVTVKNSGTAPLSITNVSISGGNYGDFSGSGTSTTCSTTTALASGASCIVTIAFAPAAAGTRTSTLVITDNAGTGSQSATLTGTGTSPATTSLTLTPTSLAFATTAVGATTAAQVVTVKNTGTTAVTLTSQSVTGTNASSFLRSATTCGTSLAVSASCTISVEFKPVAAGTLTGSLTLADNATGSPQTVSLSGTAVAAGLTVTLTPANGLNFNATAVGATTAALVATVKNTGTAAVTLTSEKITGTNATSFIISANTCTTSLAAGASCNVAVEFKPLVQGSLLATLSVADNATGSPQSIGMTGEATASSGSTVSLSPTAIAFPSTIVGNTSDVQAVTLTNTGTTSSAISAITIGGTGSTSFVQLNNCGSTLSGGASCSIYVAFKPISTGAKAGTLSVADSASGSPQTVSLSGTGTTAPSITLSATSLAFPTTTHGTTSAAKVLTLTNAGAATLTLTSITLTGANPTAFQSINTCGATLAPGANCSVFIAFSPATAGTFTAALTIADNGAASPQGVALSGTGN